jgi:lysophospholipase L1-like esterase
MDNLVVREQFEWTNIWCNNANDLMLPRVLLIGDSIACGYSSMVIKQLQGKVNVDRLGTSRSINDQVLIKETALMVEDFHYIAIHFNNGLHGWHLDEKSYASNLRQYVQLLQRLDNSAKLIWASSTPITNQGDVKTLNTENNAKVIQRNSIAEKIMREYDIPINDLYQLVLGKAELRSDDGYHYNTDGQNMLGEEVAKVLSNVLNT